MKTMFFLFICTVLSIKAFSESAPVQNETSTDQAPEAHIVSAEQGYQTGVLLHQKHNYEGAQQAFIKSLSFEPLNKQILYNLGLSAFKGNSLGLAIGSWRRAVFVDPGFTDAQEGLRLAYKKLPGSKPRDSSLISTKIKAQVLDRFSLDTFGAIFLFFILLSGHASLKYFGKRHFAFKNDLELPAWPSRAVLFSAFAIVLATLVTLKYIHLKTPRATLLIKSQSVHTGPNENTSVLFELAEGQELLLEKTQKDWAFISYPGGLSGWVPKTRLFVHSGEGTW